MRELFRYFWDKFEFVSDVCVLLLPIFMMLLFIWYIVANGAREMEEKKICHENHGYIVNRQCIRDGKLLKKHESEFIDIEVEE